MKKKTYLIAFMGIFILAVLCLVSCDKDDYSTEKYCKDKGMLYCGKKIDTCCPVGFPWNDGNGSCYNTLDYCRRTGWNCTKCH